MITCDLSELKEDEITSEQIAVIRSLVEDRFETLDGEVIIACLNSKILRAAFIQEFNNKSG